ncbi:hypothetical protein N7449_008562 [Penicillium cf. viridicatum]|uniref:Uncharacterized protein n=1 Tax=Penicillium cf. viridicatum TaxID=2972119 RepID=A0A9W9JCG8_9EURO|nr:hypothetical protein N7449_008562 [Penicillium cf. viridicatum]
MAWIQEPSSVASRQHNLRCCMPSGIADFDIPPPSAIKETKASRSLCVLANRIIGEVNNVLNLSGASVPVENERNSFLVDQAQTSAEATEATCSTSHNRFPSILSDFSTLDMFDWRGVWV